MASQKISENQGLNFLIGIFLLLAPFGNLILVLSTLKNVDDPWQINVVFHTIAVLSTGHKVFSIISLLMAGLFLTHHEQAWNGLIGFLSIQVISQLPTVSASWAQGGFHALAPIMNWLFLGSAIALKFDWTGFKLPTRQIQKKDIKISFNKKTAGENSEQKNNLQIPKRRGKVLESVRTEISQGAKRAKKIQLQFVGSQSWARLIGVTSEGMLFRNISGHPMEMSDRILELKFNAHLVVPVKFAKNEGDEYFFQFQNLHVEQVKLLNEWLARG